MKRVRLKPVAICLTLGLASVCAAAAASATVTTRSATGKATPAQAGGAAQAPHHTAAGWGLNSHFELGAGYRSRLSALPVAVVNSGGIREIAAGGGSGLALMSNGTVEAWGGNIFGQLGNGTHAQSPKPAPVKGLRDVVQVAIGGNHSMALLGNGTVYTWGGNIYGQLGNGTTGKGRESCKCASAVPILVKGLAGVASIAAGGADDVAVLANGTVEAWGENHNGELGDGTTVEKSVPTVVKGLHRVKAVSISGLASHTGHALALLTDGTVDAWGAGGSGQNGSGATTDMLTPEPVKGLTGVRAVSAGAGHSVALLSSGRLLAWGGDSLGELGFTATQKCGRLEVPCSSTPRPVPGVANVTAVSTGVRFTLAVSAGQILAWGNNADGQLGNGTTTSSTTPVTVRGLTDVTQIAAAEQHAVAITTGPPAPTDFEVIPGPGSLTATWRHLQEVEPWRIILRPVKGKIGKAIKLLATTHSHTLTGLTLGQPYEVILKSPHGIALVGVGTPTG